MACINLKYSRNKLSYNKYSVIIRIPKNVIYLIRTVSPLGNSYHLSGLQFPHMYQGRFGPHYFKDTSTSESGVLWAAL